MDKVLRLLPLLAVLLVGCVGTAYLYPVQGPLATQSPPPVVPLHVIGFSLSLALPDGETFKGKGSLVPHTQNPLNPLSAQWDLVYGSGYYLAHVLGTDAYRIATLTGDKGSTIRIELTSLTDSGGAVSQVGVAVDDKGDVFKITV
jgi:hypothetical protein